MYKPVSLLPLLAVKGLFPAYYGQPQRSLTCECGETEGVIDVPNDPCADIKLGQQIPLVAIQSMEGSPFNGSAISGTTGGVIATEAHWVAKVAAVNEDKIAVFKNLAASEIAEAEDELLGGNDVPYGGETVVSRTRSLTVYFQYFTQASIVALNQLNCTGKIRMWLSDNNDWLQGGNAGIENVTMKVGALTRPGIGNGFPRIPVTFTWEDLAEGEISAAKMPFLKTL